MMKASPLVEIKQGHQLQIGSQIKNTLNLKEKFIKILENSKKKVSFKADVLTKENLIESLQKGSKLMILSFDCSDEDYIIFEDKFKSAIKIPFENFKEIFSSNHEKLSYINCIIIISQNGAKIAEIFEELEVQNIIYFNLRNKKFPITYVFLQEFLIFSFIRFFCEFSLLGHPISYSFKTSNEKMIQKVIDNSNISSIDEFKKHLGEGPVIKTNTKIDQPLFENLPFGNYIDQSKLIYFEKTTDPFYSKNKLIYNIINLLSHKK